MSARYTVIRNADVVDFLTPEWASALAEVLKTISAGRAAKNKPTEEGMFVLNLRDKYARAALDAYIAAIDADMVNNRDPGVQAARQEAFDARTNAALRFKPEKPPIE